MIKLYNNDCFNIFPLLESGSIDLVLCDMPYGTTCNKWDSTLPLDQIFKCLDRITKPSTAIVLFGQSRFTAQLIIKSPIYRYTLIWEKSRAGGFLNASRMPLQAHEDITIHYKKLPIYNPQREEGKPYTLTQYGQGSTNYNQQKLTTTVNEGTRMPRSVVKFSNANGHPYHPTQKPVELLEYLIKTYSNEEGVVLDFCMGSGSTGVACKNLNRGFIGIELEKEYYDIAQQRILGANV